MTLSLTGVTDGLGRGAQKQGTNGAVRLAHAKYLTNKISLLPRIVFSLKVEETSNEIHC